MCAPNSNASTKIVIIIFTGNSPVSWLRYPRCVKIFDRTIRLNWIVSYTRVPVMMTMLINVGRMFRAIIPCATTKSAVARFCSFNKEKNKKNRRKYALVDDDDG